MFGYHDADQGTLIDGPVVATAEVVFTRTKHGRIKKVKFDGDSQVFRTTAAATAMPRYNGPDGKRGYKTQRLGQGLQEAFGQHLMAMLELQRPKNGNTTWRPAQAPWAGQRIEPIDFAATSPDHNAQSELFHEKNGQAGVRTAGEVTQDVLIEGLGDLRVSSSFRSEATLDAANGVLLSNSITVQTADLYYYWRTETLLLAPFTDGMTAAPGQLPGTPLL